MATKRNKGLTAAQKRDLTALLSSYEEVLSAHPTAFDEDLDANNHTELVQYGGRRLMSVISDYPNTLTFLQKLRKHNAGESRNERWLCEVDGLSRFGGSRARSIKAIMSDPTITAAQRLAELSARNK